jgi:hypothetical protein
MSLSAQFQKLQHDKLDPAKAANIIKIDRNLEAFANGFAAATRGAAARIASGKEPTQAQTNKMIKWIHDLKAITSDDLTPKFLETLPGFRKLRDACADPAMDIRLELWVSEGRDPGIHISVNPTRPFSESCVSVGSQHDETPIRKQRVAAPKKAAPKTQAGGGNISIMPQLQLKTP